MGEEGLPDGGAEAAGGFGGAEDVFEDAQEGSYDLNEEGEDFGAGVVAGEGDGEVVEVLEVAGEVAVEGPAGFAFGGVEGGFGDLVVVAVIEGEEGGGFVEFEVVLGVGGAGEELVSEGLDAGGGFSASRQEFSRWRRGSRMSRLQMAGAFT